MAYVKSKDIQLFPSAFRGQYETTGTVFNPGSRLTTEYNLTTLSSRTSKYHHSYVLQYDKETADKTIVFSLKGYLFSIKMNSYLALFTSQVWARIRLVDIDSDDTNNTKETKPVLRPVDTAASTIYLDEVSADGNFLGIDLSEEEPDAVLGQYVLLILEKVGGAWSVPSKSYFRLRADEIGDKTSTDKSIDEVFNTEDLTATKINNVTIATTGTSGTVTITDGKELKVKGNVTLAGTGTATFDKNLTVLGTHNMVLKTADANRTLTLKGSPTLSGITTTGSGTLALNKNLTVNNNNIILEASGADRTLKISDASKEIAGAGTKLTLGGNLTTSGAHATTITTTGTTTVTLPKTGTLVSRDTTDTLTNKTLTGPKISALSGNYTYNIIGSALSADRNVTLPLLTADDEIVFLNHPQTLTNKTLTSPSLTTPNIGVATATSINKVAITAPTNASTLTVEDGKALTVKQTITLNGDASRTLTINGANKTLAGAGTKLTLGGNLTTTGAYNTTLTTTGSTSITLPTTGTLATIAGTENLTNKTVNGLTLTSKTSGFEISGGTTSKKLTIADTVKVVATVNVVEPVSIQAPLYVDAPLNVDGASEVKIRSAGESQTTITGPNDGEAKLITGTYTTSATTANSSTSVANYLVKRDRYQNVYANAFYASSDERLKENVVDYVYRDSILDVPVKEFDYKATGVHAIGFIAQELQEKFPELVTSGEDGYLSIAENKLVYLLLEEVKQLKEEVEQLKRGG